MPEPAKPLIDQPKSAKPKGPEAKIFTMPAKYRGAAKAADVSRMAVPKPEKVVEKRKPVPPPLPKPPKLPPPPKPTKPAGPAKKKSGFPVKLVVIGIVIIALFAAAAIVVWFSLNRAEPEPEVTTPITPPVVEEEEEEPLAVEEEEEPPVEEEEEEPEDPFEQELHVGTDSDSDGLTDIEETLYGTSPQLPDSDADGFLDGNEVFNRYNPNGLAPGSLFESGLVMLFDDPAFSYTIFYPTIWNMRAVGGPAEQVVFTAATSEVVQVIKHDKDSETTIMEWFLTQDGAASADDLLEFTTKEGLTGAMSPNRLTAYVDAGSFVYVVSYNVGTKATIDYLQTFQMMLNSLVLR